MENINITNAQYLSFEDIENYAISVEIDGIKTNVPVDPNNRHYAEIMRQVDAGELTIAEAD
jgi:hypothetical protein